MQLTFSEGYFHATEVKPSDFQEWERVGPLHFRTNSLRLAAPYQGHGDEIAQRVFERTFNKELPLPKISSRLEEFLDPHQIAGVRWVLSRKRSYLAHAPGAGKTAEAIVAACLTPGPGQVVFIVPPGLELNWEKEIFRFSTRFVGFPRIGVIGRTENQRAVAWRADFLIVPDSMLIKPWVYEKLSKMRIRFLAVDEASRFKESTSNRSIGFYGGGIKIGPQKVKMYPGLFHNAGRVVLLDGSPMPNRAMELWAPIYALDPEAIDCMSQQDFGFKYCGAKQNERGVWEFKHSSNETELRDRLRRRFMHVVLETELNHPERRRSLLFMNQDVRSAQMRDWERKHLKDISPDSLSEDMSQGEVAGHRRELGIRKIPWSLRYIQERIHDKNEKLLVFAWHREVCEEIYKRLSAKYPGDFALVYGGTSKEDQARAFHAFQEGKLRGIVGNIAAMGRGHNLQKADRVVFVEPSWSDEWNKQCEKRASRRGRDQEAFVRCEYIVAPDSMDERVMTALFSKQQRVKRVIG